MDIIHTKKMNILEFFKNEGTDNSDNDRFLNELVVNRVGGIVYKKLMNEERSRYYTENFMTKLKEIYLLNIQQNRDMLSNLEMLCRILKDVSFKYAFLKGAYLIPYEYELGMRVSNDIDILIDKKAVSLIQDIFQENGFIQGDIVDGKLKPATRSEIINSKLNYGETVPFIKKIGERFLNVDLNISMDFKSDNESKVQKILENTVELKFKGLILNTLKLEEFVIHLCCHLYKEATTYDWVASNRNLLLYKFYDIYFILNKYGNDTFINKLFEKILFYETEKECFYTFYYVKEIFSFVNNLSIDRILALLSKLVHKECLREVFNPSEKKIYHYTGTFKEWFNSLNKLGQLKEVE